MRFLLSLIAITALCLTSPVGAHASQDTKAKDTVEHSMGSPNAPLTLKDLSSMTCTHCAAFYNNVLPELKKRYIDTGKVRFILIDFPLDGPSFKASAIAHCIPQEQFFPFVGVLYKDTRWATAKDPEKSLIQLAQLAGLEKAKAENCVNNSQILDNIVVKRMELSKKYNVRATPTFVINDGVERLEGERSVEEFSAIFDRLLAAKK